MRSDACSIECIIPRRGVNDDGKGKKYALHKLISAASAEYVWLMDDDVLPAPRASLDRPLEVLAEGIDLLILPLRMCSVNARPNLIERLQIAEYAAIQQLTIESALRGHPVMCSGANLIVRRSRWLESYPDIHPGVPSGDDMFLLESFKRRGLVVSVIDDPDYTATVYAQATLAALLRQRMRWAGKAPYYRDRDILLCGIIVAGANILQILCPLVIFIKFPLEYCLVRKRTSEVSFFTVLLLELIYPFYMLLCLLGGLFRRRW